MTAEMPANNSEETLAEDNFEETGAELDEVGGHEAQPESEEEAPNTTEGDDFWHGSPEDIPAELQPVYKNMQGAFTKRMQRLSSLEQKYFESIDAANAAVLARAQAEAPRAQEPVQEEAPPDLAAGAKPEDVIQYYVQQEVVKALKSTGVDNLAKEMEPVAHRERVLGAYRQFASNNPKLEHKRIAPLAGRIIDSDPELAQLASVNPAAAIKLAARVAQAELKAATTQQKTKKKRQAAPVSARSGTPVKRKRESMLEAATRALKESGVNPDFF